MKYKKQKAENWFLRIDDKGNKIQFHKDKQPQMYQEMINSGLEIEEFETQEEIEEREKEEKKQALAAQYSTCKNLLDKTQHKVNGDYDYPADATLWVTWRNQIKSIMRSDELQEIPDPPWELED